MRNLKDTIKRSEEELAEKQLQGVVKSRKVGLRFWFVPWVTFLLF